MEKICGTVDTIIFASQDNRFTVLKLSPEKLSTQITVTLNGIAPLIIPQKGTKINDKDK